MSGPGSKCITPIGKFTAKLILYLLFLYCVLISEGPFYCMIFSCDLLPRQGLLQSFHGLTGGVMDTLTTPHANPSGPGGGVYTTAGKVLPVPSPTNPGPVVVPGHCWLHHLEQPDNNILSNRGERRHAFSCSCSPSAFGFP